MTDTFKLTRRQAELLRANVVREFQGVAEEFANVEDDSGPDSEALRTKLTVRERLLQQFGEPPIQDWL